MSDDSSAPEEQVSGQVESEAAPKGQHTIPGWRVDKIAEKAKLEAQQGMQAELETLKQQVEGLKNAQQQAFSMQQQSADMEAQSVIRTYEQQLAAKKAEAPDEFGDLADVAPNKVPFTAYHATKNLDNMPDVMRELQSDRLKRLAVESLLRNGDPEGIEMLKDISQGLKKRQQAQLDAKKTETAEPLSKLAPITVGAGGVAKKSISEIRQELLRKKSR